MRIKEGTRRQVIKISLSLAFAALFFQNCSKVNFQEATSESNSFNQFSETLIVKAQERYQQADILFVMDDSCSMNSIIANVKKGIESLSSVSFPEDTLVGVTYMSPALQGSNGMPVFENAYFHVKNYTDIDLIAHSPGFLKLVNAGNSIHYKNFISNVSGVVDTFSAEMCDQSWFSPLQQSRSMTNTCLAAAMQSPLLCTGAEAGLVSLKQLIQKYQQSGQKLFRENSLAQIIFLSDTHDPGANYYGKTGALSAQPSYEEIKTLIYAINPNLQGVRFSGILPLPRLGDPLLDGLNTIGKILGPDDSTSMTEETYQYSYLDFIKKSNGMALHAEQSDWSATITKLIEESALYKEVVVETLYSHNQIQSIFINDTRIELNQVEKINDNKVVIRLKNVATAQEYKIVINYNL